MAYENHPPAIFFFPSRPAEALWGPLWSILIPVLILLFLRHVSGLWYQFWHHLVCHLVQFACAAQSFLILFSVFLGVANRMNQNPLEIHDSESDHRHSWSVTAINGVAVQAEPQSGLIPATWWHIESYWKCGYFFTQRLNSRWTQADSLAWVVRIGLSFPTHAPQFETGCPSNQGVGTDIQSPEVAFAVKLQGFYNHEWCNGSLIAGILVRFQLLDHDRIEVQFFFATLAAACFFRIQNWWVFRAGELSLSQAAKFQSPVSAFMVQRFTEEHRFHAIMVCYFYCRVSIPQAR